MNENIHKYFKIGTLSWMSYPDLKAYEAIEKIAGDDFFYLIEISTIEEKERAKVKAILTQSHMQIRYGTQPVQLIGRINPNALDEQERVKAEKILRECMNEAEYLGASGITIMAGKWEANSVKEHYKQIVKTTKNLCQYAMEKNMRVDLEIFDFDVDKKVFIGSASLAAAYAKEIRKTYDNFGLVVDLSHIPLIHEDVKTVIEKLKPYITHFHIGNAVIQKRCQSFGDNHPRFGFENSEHDVRELSEFLLLLCETGFCKIKTPFGISFEVKPQPGENADVIMANCKRTLKEAWSQVTVKW